MSIFDLSGRTAVITGGNGGIGLGIAQALNAAGCNVSIWGRNADKNKNAAATMAKGPGKVATIICDVSDPASVKAAMKATLDTFGRVDGCFANAGIGGGGRRAFIDRTEEEWRKMFATNLDGVFHVFQAAARHMTERAEAGDKFGRLVATSSLASLRTLCRYQGGAERAVPGPRRRACALRRHRECDPAGLDQKRHDGGHHGQRKIRRQRHAADSGAPVRRAQRFRRYRRLHHEPGVVVSYGGLLRDRRRIHGVLTFVVIARSEATKQSILSSRGDMDCFAEPVIGRAFARPVGSQ
jgi:hypothetical protein